MVRKLEEGRVVNHAFLAPLQGAIFQVPKPVVFAVLLLVPGLLSVIHAGFE